MSGPHHPSQGFILASLLLALLGAVPLLADRASGGAQAGTRGPGETAMPSAALFKSFQALAGTWEGKSTAGWTEKVTIRTIAGGSVVVVNSFEAHPGEEMLTTYYLDGDELQLRHYCIAGNQPRLAATASSPDGSEVTFTFKDATNLPSRDKGHMDKVVFRFDGEDSFSSRWTWYQDGKESWMEEIEYRRVR